MLKQISRRLFLTSSVSCLVAPNFLRGAGEVPELLDHIVLGCSDLDRGIAFVEDHTGVRAALGGIHPGRGTRNALLGLGERRYLEIIAPDPQQSTVKQFTEIGKMTVPRLVGWAAHPGDLDQFARKLQEAQVPFDGPRPGSRTRPDGRVLKWRSLGLTDDRHGLLPFFIEWSRDSIHPAADAPAGCELRQFAIASPDRVEIARMLLRIGMAGPVEPGQKDQLRASIVGPKGIFEIRS